MEPSEAQFEQCITLEDIKTTKSEIQKFNKTLTVLTMQNTFMMLRKIVSHPYLIHFPLDPKSDNKQLLIDDNLIAASGKMKVLDILLPHLKARGHKVCIIRIREKNIFCCLVNVRINSCILY